MAKNSINIELPQLDKLLEKMDAILAALQACGTPYSAPAETSQEDAGEPDLQAPAMDPTQPETPTGDAEPARAVDRGDVQKMVVKLSAAGKKEKAREIVKGYAEKVSAIPEDKLAEVLDKLTALEG